jgi:hypothetical protein
LETVLLGFVRDKESLRELKRTLVRSNTRGVYKPDDDDQWVAAHPEINRIATEIEARRIALNKDSGFERLYARVTKLYFGGMARHFASLRKVLSPGAKLAYVVGDQASYLRVLIRTGQLLGEIAESLGYRVDNLELFRTRIATATKEQMREEVLLLTWLGKQQKNGNGSRTKIRKTEQLLERVFLAHYNSGDVKVCFARAELSSAASKLRIKLPKNLGDLVYSFRYRASLPESITSKAPCGQEWIIRPAGRSKYCFVAVFLSSITPSPMMAQIKVPDATPGVIEKYRLSDEQALLAKLRYNRLLDIFTGVTCYSLQNHLRTTVPEMGQVETDELYIGIDRRGAHYVFPVQAKGGRDKISIVQIEQDYAMCKDKFSMLICRPIAARSRAKIS